MTDAILARARARAKSAWSASMRDDDLTERAASEQRLMAAWPKPRVRPARAFVLGAAAAAFVVVAAFAMVRSIGSPAGGGSAQAASTALSNAVNAAPNASGAAPVSTNVLALPNASPSSSVSGRSIVLTGACPDCRVSSSSMARIEPGALLGATDNLSVPRGSRVTIGFALQGALVDPGVGVDLEGPAVASAPDDRTISLMSGSARFRGLREVVLTVPGGRVAGEGATFTVRIDARGVARIVVEKGHVVVTTRQTDLPQTLDVGGVLEIPAEPSPSPASAPAPPAGVTAPATAAATAAASAASAPPANEVTENIASARRASFTKAEVEMASGDPAERERGRARLADLAVCPDVKLAWDAATLLARSETTATGRADTWARYLATQPPGSYRNRALLERAAALLESGRTTEANVILAELRAAPLSEPQKRQLDRLTFKAGEPR